MYKAIFFDLGGVVFTSGSEIFSEVYGRRYQIPPEKIKEIVRGSAGNLYREGKITKKEYWEIVRKKFNFQETPERLEKDLFSFYQPISGMKELLNKLSENYRLYYLSDNVPERIKWLDEKFGLLRWFKGGVSSFDVGVRKPDQKIFQEALKRAGVQAEESIFIDDKQKNVEGARNLGMAAFLFKSAEQLKRDLGGIGVV